jgi:hypothetical protein
MGLNQSCFKFDVADATSCCKLVTCLCGGDRVTVWLNWLARKLFVQKDLGMK